jgi:hypothetical protein
LDWRANCTAKPTGEDLSPNFSPRPQAETLRTEFLPPNGFWTLSLAFGSGNHCPSTTKRYSCRPGLIFRSPTHRPFPTRLKGVRSGFHSLNEPATYTVLASGLTNSSDTLPAFVVSGRAGAGTTAFAKSLLTTALFDFLVVLIIISLKHFVLRDVQKISDAVRKQWPCRPGAFSCHSRKSLIIGQSSLERPGIWGRRLFSFVHSE